MDESAQSADLGITTRISQRAEKTGIGALLASLREDNLSVKLNNLSTHAQSSGHENVEDKIEETKNTTETSDEIFHEDTSRSMNRKEKRRLQRLQETETRSAKKRFTEFAQIPCKLMKRYCDTSTFSFYKASFGYGSTKTNNFVHFSLQNDDGIHAIVASQDRFIRMYSLNEKKVEWKHNTAGLILDACWERSGKGVFSTSKLRPIQLFEAGTGTIIGSYNGKDSGDNIKEAMCIGQTGNTLIGGFKNYFQLWNVECTGNAKSSIKTYDKNYSSGFNGIAMSVNCHPTMSDVFAAAGTSRVIATYSINWKNAVSTIEGSSKGYTNIRFSPDGVRLYASERSGDIHCFDTRMNMIFQVLQRDMTTSHRTRFDIENTGRLLFSGTSSGGVVVYDLHDYNEEMMPVFVEKVAQNCIPCVSIRNNTLVLCTGQRSFPDDPALCEEAEEKKTYAFNNSFQVFDIQSDVPPEFIVN